LKSPEEFIRKLLERHFGGITQTVALAFSLYGFLIKGSGFPQSPFLTI
jgi:hypothetical protein